MAIATRQAPPTLGRAVLEANLAEAQAALHSLMIGMNTTTVTYSTGDGTRSVTYTQTDIKQVQAYIAQLQTQLGYRARRALGFRL